MLAFFFKTFPRSQVLSNHRRILIYEPAIFLFTTRWATSISRRSAAKHLTRPLGNQLAPSREGDVHGDVVLLRPYFLLLAIHPLWKSFFLSPNPVKSRPRPSSTHREARADGESTRNSVLRCRHLQTRKAAWTVPIWKFWRFRTATTTVVVFSAPISCLVFAKLQRGLSISFFEALCRNKISKIFSILLFLYFDATVWEFLVHLSILMWNFNFYKGLTWKMMNRFSSVFK